MSFPSNAMAQAPPIELDIHDIEHLGIIAGIVDEIGIVEIVNGLVGTHPQEKVSAGHVVKALILNGLGFLTAPLYLFSQFFEGKATEHLIGRGILPEQLNDSRLGRVLDQLHTIGLTCVFVAIAVAAVLKFDIDTSRAHLDGSSMYVHGQYLNGEQPSPADGLASGEQPATAADSTASTASEDASAEPVPITITHGYSRDRRPDLKQFTLQLLSCGDADVPLFFKVGNGNDADKAVFSQVISEFQQQWSAAKPEVFVTDSAFYCEENLKNLDRSGTAWITRVPATIAEVPELLQTLPPVVFTDSSIRGYRIAEVGSIYAGIRQRWLVVESDARKRAALKQLDKRVAKALKQKTKDLKGLTGRSFACEADALSALERFAKGLKYHTLSDFQVLAKPYYDTPGRPPKGSLPKGYTYHPTATLVPDEQALERQRTQAGRFILATNLLQIEDEDEDENLLQHKSADEGQKHDVDLPQQKQWFNDTILHEYKQQQACERGFKFLKDPLFFASRLFVEKAQRIAALAMIMGLCLLVYSLGQRQLRKALAQANETIPNQKGKPTAKPTLRWVMQCFQSVHLVWLNGRKWVIKLTKTQEHILRFLGAACCKYYFLC